MKAPRSVASLTLVALLCTALPARAASRHAVTDVKGTTAAVQTMGQQASRGFSGPPRPSWKVWGWIGVGLAAGCLVAKGMR